MIGFWAAGQARCGVREGGATARFDVATTTIIAKTKTGR
jgi:hypothetical protein